MNKLERDFVSLFSCRFLSFFLIYLSHTISHQLKRPTPPQHNEYDNTKRCSFIFIFTFLIHITAAPLKIMYNENAVYNGQRRNFLFFSFFQNFTDKTIELRILSAKMYPRHYNISNILAIRTLWLTDWLKEKKIVPTLQMMVCVDDTNIMNDWNGAICAPRWKLLKRILNAFSCVTAMRMIQNVQRVFLFRFSIKWRRKKNKHCLWFGRCAMIR